MVTSNLISDCNMISLRRVRLVILLPFLFFFLRVAMSIPKTFYWICNNDLIFKFLFFCTYHFVWTFSISFPVVLKSRCCRLTHSLNILINEFINVLFYSTIVFLRFINDFQFVAPTTIQFYIEDSTFHYFNLSTIFKSFPLNRKYLVLLWVSWVNWYLISFVFLKMN